MVKYKDKIESLKEQGIFSDEQAEQLTDTLKGDTHEEIEDNIEVERKPMPYGLIISSLLVLSMSAVGFVSYNGVVTKEENTKTAWSQVESNLQRKLDLLPNLIKVVKQYAKHEKEVFTEVTALRANIQKSLKGGVNINSKDIEEFAYKNAMLRNSISKIMLVSERYPELKSSEQFLQLQSQIEGSENRINITRMLFNKSVSDYNSYIRRMPAKIVANLGGFKTKGYFKAEEKAKNKLDLGI